MIKVGITGGIGSGKSTVAKVFEVLGIPVYYADDAAKKLMHNDEILKSALVQQFGAETYTNGELNRAYLSNIVFNNSEQLTLLNAIVHPATIRDSEQWMQRQTTPYAIKEAALIFESGAQHHLDYIIGVTAPAALRIQRVMKRDGITEKAVQERMAKQLDETEKMRLCNYVITNDEHTMVLPQVLALHKLLVYSRGVTF